MIRQPFCRWWVAGLALLVLGACLSAQAQVRIKRIEVRHIGPPAASEELVKANIRLKEGDLFGRAAADDDVRTLYATGFFYNVRVAEESSPDGITLIYAVQGKPRVSEIKIQGNKKYSERKLRKSITSKVGDPLDERKLFADTQALREKYQKSGYQKTTVKYTLNIEENLGRGTVTFEIEETPKVKIIDVTFDNATAFPQKKLRKVVKTRRTWMFAWLTGAGKLKDEQLEDDKGRLSDFYHEAGYIDFDLKDIRQELTTTNKMILHFVVAEGRRYKVGSVSMTGTAVFPTNKVLRVTRMGAGALFTPRGLSRDMDAIQDFYGSQGYIEARVNARKVPNTEAGTMDLKYEIAEGEKCFIEKVEIKGNVKTKDHVVRRELSVAPGEVFDMVKVKRSKTRLEQMNYFERVDARPEDTDVPNRKNLAISVDEKNTGNFTVGAGFSTVESLVGYAEMTQGNFDLFKPWDFSGGGQKLRVRATLGLERMDYMVSFVEPWFLDRKLALGVDFYHRKWQYLSDYYDERRTGMRVSLTRALGSEFLIGSVSGTLENIGVEDVSYVAPSTIWNARGSYTVGRLASSIAYDTRNSTMLPNGGQRTEVTAEMVGGDFSLYRLELRSAWYFKGLAAGHVLEVLARMGVMDGLSNSKVNPEAGEVHTYWTTNRVVDPNSGLTNFISVPYAITNLPPNSTPFFERFYLGGPYNLRGFRYRDVGPHESPLNPALRPEPVGGNTYYMASAEYSIPIVDRVRVAFFYDMGNVYYKSFDMDFGKFSANVGAGMRLNLPIGPLRLDYGYPIREANGEGKSGRFNFSVGYTREF